MFNPIVLGAGGFFGKEGVVRGVALGPNGLYESQASISLLNRIAKDKYFFLFFCLNAKEPKSQDASKASPRKSAAWLAAASSLPALKS